MEERVEEQMEGRVREQVEGRPFRSAEAWSNRRGLELG